MLGKPLRWFLKAAFSRYTTRLIFPVIGAIPVALFAASDLKTPVPKIFWDWFKEFDEHNPGVRTIVVFLPVTLIPLGLAFEWCRDKFEKADKLAEQELGLLLRVLEKPVGRKRQSFGALVKRLQKNGNSLELTHLMAAADPLEQIRALVEGIHFVFQADVQRPDELKVTLARMENGVIDDFECYLPSKAGPRTPIADLQTPDCLFSVAARERRIVIVPDIASEVNKPKKTRRYTGGRIGSDDKGSILCYPVTHRELDTIPYVIGVKYSEPKHFTTSRERRYEFMLSQFAERISLEFPLVPKVSGALWERRRSLKLRFPMSASSVKSVVTLFLSFPKHLLLEPVMHFGGEKRASRA